MITYNANSSSVRCRFSIAHELGHFALSHRPISFSELFNGDLGRDARQEREANIFAAQASDAEGDAFPRGAQVHARRADPALPGVGAGHGDTAQGTRPRVQGNLNISS